MEVIKIDTEIAEAFKIDIFEVQQMVKKYQELTLIEADEASYKICRVALTSCIKTRTGINKRRLKLNKEDQERIKSRNTAAKQLTAIIEPAEDHLTALVKGEDSRIDAIKIEEEKKQHKLTQERVDVLFKMNCVMPFMEVAFLSDDEFENLRQTKEEEYAAEQVRLFEIAEATKKENERLEMVRKEQEVEANRLADIQTKQEAEAKAFKKEQMVESARLKEQADEIAVQQKAIQDEKDRIAKKEADKIEAAKTAKVKMMAAEKAAEEKADREAREKAEKKKTDAKEKKRQKVLKPDKVKTTQWIESFDFPTTPDITDPGLIEIVRITLEYLELTLRNAMKEIYEL